MTNVDTDTIFYLYTCTVLHFKTFTFDIPKSMQAQLATNDNLQATYDNKPYKVQLSLINNLES